MEQSAAEFRFNEAPGFGSRLRAVREARGLDLETCGHALHLPVRVVRQLEGSDYSGIDYQVYLGGYLRKYGRYLDIDESEIERAITQLRPAQPKLVSTGGVPHSRYLLDQYAKAATYVVLTLVIAVPTVWLGMRGTLTHDMGRLAPLDATPVAQQDAPSPTVPASAGSAAKAVAGTAAIAQTPAAAPSVTASAPSPAAAQQPLLASMVPMPNLDNDTATIATPAAGNVPAAAIGSGAHSLTLNLANASWVEVLGKDGTRLEYGLLPAGTSKTYHSDQLLDVRIGNANGAQVSVDGQSMPLDAYRHANIAHFRLDVQNGKATPAGA
ncbi:helix-turn-helix domain-containing protein [Dyella choica]|uniref:Helix-turn-helix domain-containing protein n=1 Tax=Dyella choica TaxID=1927959 RepID=A0A3S0Q262_9GAMM|nr:helix-turn-helix domain-containing protein [Dyella choica]RUL70141.1 helix-turn-helix domain-containing protein [Dyella choica]